MGPALLQAVAALLEPIPAELALPNGKDAPSERDQGIGRSPVRERFRSILSCQNAALFLTG
jgi:hypothetical protein